MQILPLNNFESTHQGVKCLKCGSSSVRIEYQDYETLVGTTNIEVTFTCESCEIQESIDTHELEQANDY